jgi:hypothetical protein
MPGRVEVTRVGFFVAVLAVFSLSGDGAAQQVADSTFDVSVLHPAYTRGAGPVVAFDEAHHNFHTRDGRYLPLARLLENDGYRVRANSSPFTAATLDSFQVLIVANAIGGRWDAGAYGRPAFTDAETAAVEQWIQRGGSLLLIADHAPMGVAAEPLGRALGVAMGKGYTEDSTAHFSIGGFGTSVLLFSRGNGLLGDHPITRGRNPAERVDSVVAFTGQSLRGPPGAEPLLALGDNAVDHPSPTPEQAARSANPGTAWMTAVEGLPTTPASGRAQGLAFRRGRGRVVVLGEAAMLSAQAVFNPRGERVGIAGMNVPGTGNRQFALNVLHWLSEEL